MLGDDKNTIMKVEIMINIIINKIRKNKEQTRAERTGKIKLCFTFRADLHRCEFQTIKSYTDVVHYITGFSTNICTMNVIKMLSEKRQQLKRYLHYVTGNAKTMSYVKD